MKYSFQKRQRERKIERLVRELEKVRWRYRNTILFLISIFIAYLILRNEVFEKTLYNLGRAGYLGSFFSGVLYAFSLSVAISTAIFYKMGKYLNPLFIAFIGAFGSVLSDYFIFRFVRDNLVDEIKLLVNNTSKKVIKTFKSSIFYKIFPFSNLALSETFERLWFKISRSKKWKFFISLLGCCIIASPLPDELGIALLGSIKLESRKFVIFSYLLNLIGIFLIASLAF
ncbi:MAG: hypothetical protein NZ942_03490 [Candidatus Aenigmarchaeota archaeon]|nr:hypothetical protein [Candidatus Aenigmarchaeota archaeon]